MVMVGLIHGGGGPHSWWWWASASRQLLRTASTSHRQALEQTKAYPPTLARNSHEPTRYMAPCGTGVRGTRGPCNTSRNIILMLLRRGSWHVGAVYDTTVRTLYIWHLSSESASEHNSATTAHITIE